jgi:hypothetical protein
LIGLLLTPRVAGHLACELLKLLPLPRRGVLPHALGLLAQALCVLPILLGTITRPAEGVDLLAQSLNTRRPRLARSLPRLLTGLCAGGLLARLLCTILAGLGLAGFPLPRRG